MTLLAGTLYDPAVAVSKATSSLLAMTAIDTTNLRLTFTTPAATYDGSHAAVLVKLRGVIHGATTSPQILLGVLQSTTVIGRVTPIGGWKNPSLLATSQVTVEALFVVPLLTPSSSVTWDAAYGVDVVAASTGLKYGGPDNTTTNDAFGGFAFEVYDTPNLLGAVLYDPAAEVTTKVTTSLLAMTALDTTNARIPFTGPASGKVIVRVKATGRNGAPTANVLLGVLDGATKMGRQSPIGGDYDTVGVANRSAMEVSFVVTGLTPGNSYSWDAAYGVEIVSGSPGYIGYGGANDTTSNNATGALAYEIWAAA